MKTNLFFYVLVGLIFFSCKQKLNKEFEGTNNIEVKLSKDNKSIEKTDTNKENTIIINTNCLSSRLIKSVYQLCGGPCSISYTEKDISVVKGKIKVSYNAVMYIYEDVEDQWEGNLFIECRDSVAFNLYFETSKNENQIDNPANGSNISFQGYANELCSCLR